MLIFFAMMSYLLIIATAAVLTTLIYLIIDYSGPALIPLKAKTEFGMKGFRVKDLIVHEFDHQGNLYASRGMIIYCLYKGEKKFKRIAHVPSSSIFYWLNNFRFFRLVTLKPECIELTVGGDGKILAMSSGYFWYKEARGNKFKKTFKLTHYGFGVGRGILSNGLLRASDENVFFGEYFRNKDRIGVRIFKSKDFGQTFKIAYEFKPGTIRHIHCLKKDPYTGKLWICTGDKAGESMIGWSDDEFRSIEPIGQGTYAWVACQLIFSEDAVYWCTDTSIEEMAGIYRWDKKTMELRKLSAVQGTSLDATRLTNGTIVMSTVREGCAIERDDKTQLIFINENDIVRIIPFGTWDFKTAGFRYSFAKLRLQRSQDNDLLTISCLNHKEVNDGDLVFYSGETINQMLKDKLLS
jgi:hypothetical protein